MDKNYLVEIKSYWQTCWQLLHTSLHSLSTFFSFMMEKRKDNPQSFCHCFPLLGFGSPSSPLSFGHVQIQCDRLSLQLDFSCSSIWIPVCELKQSFAPLFLFPLRVPSVVWVSKAHSPCFSNKITFGCERITFCLLFLPKIFYSSCLPPPPFLVAGILSPSSQSFERCKNSDTSELEDDKTTQLPSNPL